MNLIIALIVALVGFGGGWVTNGWRLGEEVQALKTQHEKTIYDAAQATNRSLINLTNQRDAKADRLAAIDADYTAKLTKAKHENKILADRLAVGTIGLRIAATCPTNPAGDPKTPEGGGVDPAAGAVLDPAARRAYSALRDGITTTETTLSACQKSLAEFSPPSPP